SLTTSSTSTTAGVSPPLSMLSNPAFSASARVAVSCTSISCSSLIGGFPISLVCLKNCVYLFLRHCCLQVSEQTELVSHYLPQYIRAGANDLCAAYAL